MTASSWRDGDDQLRSINLNRRELHLVQRLRMLEGGTHLVIVVKCTRGRDGLTDFVVQEAIPVPKT